MNANIIALSDALHRAFDETITKGKTEAEVLMIEILQGDNLLKIPNPKFDPSGWKELCKALKYRHKLEAFYTRHRHGDQVLICPFGWLSEAPLIEDADVEAAMRAYAVAEDEAQHWYETLMKSLGVK
jgi:hypothetical protein